MSCYLGAAYIQPQQQRPSFYSYPPTSTKLVELDLSRYEEHRPRLDMASVLDVSSTVRSWNAHPGDDAAALAAPARPGGADSAGG